jgi:hypothetical protein
MSASNTKDDNPAANEVTYRVTVTKITTNVVFRDREYKEIGQKDDGESEYGYVYFDNIKDVVTNVYKQELEDIDMPAVIKAVNGMDN